MLTALFRLINLYENSPSAIILTIFVIDLMLSFAVIFRTDMMDIKKQKKHMKTSSFRREQHLVRQDMISICHRICVSVAVVLMSPRFLPAFAYGSTPDVF